MGFADIGMHASVYLQPDTVSFKGVGLLELDAPATATGPYSCEQGIGHQASPIPVVAVADDVPGLGTPVATDTVESGSCSGNQLEDGSIAFNIPQLYSVGADGPHQFSVVQHIATSTILGALTTFLLWISLTPAGLAQGSGLPDKTEARIAAAMTGLQRFQSSRSIEDLRATSHALFSAVNLHDIRAEDLVTRRRSITIAFAQVLHQMESLSDPAFDPNDLPWLCVTPPREPNGRQLPACADPKVIADPAIRAEYAAAIDANSAKIARGNAQAKLYLLEDETTGLLAIVLSRFRPRAPSDAAALDGILRRAHISDARRAKIDASF